jgi:hypothetical protein
MLAFCSCSLERFLKETKTEPMLGRSLAMGRGTDLWENLGDQIIFISELGSARLVGRAGTELTLLGSYPWAASRIRASQTCMVRCDRTKQESVYFANHCIGA